MVKKIFDIPVKIILDTKGIIHLTPTAFGAVMRYIFYWWENGCPSHEGVKIEWQTLLGMRPFDFQNHRNAILPVLEKLIPQLHKNYAEKFERAQKLSNCAKHARYINNLGTKRKQKGVKHKPKSDSPILLDSDTISVASPSFVPIPEEYKYEKSTFSDNTVRSSVIKSNREKPEKPPGLFDKS
jgi:hypothetical protein